MDALGIGIIVFAAVFIVGGLVAGQLATKASHKDTQERKNDKIN